MNRRCGEGHGAGLASASAHALAGRAALVLVATVAALLAPAVRTLRTTEYFPPGTGDEITGAGQCAGR
ncbi:hypothetical protein SAV14893_074650 [Streptomyces avermitilis]|uniref:Uncharacterized protein n=1 Tax=Streptomyces avermitilis TaxID=33903 RepID=A0A4D4MHR3_STRAX|nr:hypothetical protein SAVMC3_87580 [Streptomyces avermitilis]GDY68072.1 hypothetical protein SAV14893_074650 [Streptomyces avermitilis]GDY71593.1 hypothetical protein SAV31267_010780 [Streptomyces avermitilis]